MCPVAKPFRQKLFFGRHALAGVAAILMFFSCAGQNQKNPPAPPRPAAVRPSASSQQRPPARAPNLGTYSPNKNTVPSNNKTTLPTNQPTNLGGLKPGSNQNPHVNLPSSLGLNGGSSAGSRFGFPANPGKTIVLKSGGSATIRPNGQLRSIDRNGTHIDYEVHGTRTISSIMPNGSGVVTTGPHQGFVQRSYLTRNGHTYVQRTYVVNNVTHTVAYRSYSYRGAVYYGYASAYYYRPVFYRWAYNPWPALVFWNWGWTPAAYPWFGYYGYYFAPYPAYPSAAYWLTDYLMASNLQAAYAAGVSSSNAAYGSASPPAAQQDAYTESGKQTVALSPQVKQAITEEVRAELAREDTSTDQGHASGGAIASATPGNDDVPPALDPALRTFVVASSLDVVSGDQECTLTPGDVITRLTDTPDQDQKVVASVSSSKKADCAPGKQVFVAVQDLQEMQNHFREQLDSGLRVLAAKQGTGGIPQAPGATLVVGEVPPPVADATAAQAIQAQEAAADQAERDASQQVPGQS
jgi:hypothetical protein